MLITLLDHHVMPRSSPVTPPRARVPGTALNRQLFIVLRDEITRGVYAESGALPKEETLCERFGVSRITVRRALADLAALGLVERRHGLGTFVKASTLASRSGPTLSVIDGLRQTARETEVEVLNVERVPAPPDVAAVLQLEPGEAAVHALRLRKMEGMPVMLTDAWVPAALGKRVSAAALRKHALFEILMAQGVKFGRVVQEITAQLADPTYAGWLQTEVGAPLLKLVRLLHDPEGHPIQYLTVYLSPERSRILMDIPADRINTLSAGQVVHDILTNGDL